MRAAIILWVAVLLLAIIGPQGLYTVDETQLAVVTRFGDIRDVHTSSGLKVKIPFIDTVNRFDRRLLRVDMPPSTLPDKDKELMIIDAYARYIITDVRKFFEKLRDQDAADDRIGRIVVSALREEVARRNKEEIVGGQITEQLTEAGERIVISTNSRQEILGAVLAASNSAVKSTDNDFGVEVRDVRIKRADLPAAALLTTFERMRSERERISRGLRAEGQEERDKVEADANLERATILASADKTAAQVRGEGEARAIEIFAQALELDPEFFSFQRSLEAYRKIFTDDTTVVLSADSELFQFLENPQSTSPLALPEE